MTTREQVMAALLTLICDAYEWTTPPQRRLKLWTDVAPTERPCAFIFEGGEEAFTFNQNAIAKVILTPKVFAYIDAKDPTVIGATLINQIMDALQAAFVPQGSDAATGRNTLGGLVYNCRLNGRPFKDPGDIDGDGILIVPVEITFS